MTFDMNDVTPQQSGDLIPDGTFAKVTMSIRKGGTDGMSEVDRGLLKPSNQPGSDVLMLDAEFTVVEGPHARRKFWQLFTEPPRVYRRVKHSKDEPYDKETIHPRLSG